MLKNYFEMDESLTLSNFLKKLNDKKNSHYIILNTNPKSFVDVRTLALKINTIDEKLKNIKKNLAHCNKSTKNEKLNFLIETGDRVINTNEGIFDFIDALKLINESEIELLNEKIKIIEKEEIFALTQEDKISNARNLFLKKKINLLPLIEKNTILGEVRPIDLLISDLFNQNTPKGNLYDKNHKNNILNLPITNLVNKRPITISKELKIKNIINVMINKKLPSLIIVDENEKLYSIVSYGDIFNLYQKTQKNFKFNIEYSGTKELYGDEFSSIKKFANNSMIKITKISKYDNLKLTFKSIGEKEESSHKTKLIIRGLISSGNKVIQAEKEIIKGTSNELQNHKRKNNWNVPQLVQELLNILTKKVINDKNKSK